MPGVAAFVPIRVREVELTRPLEPVAAADPDGARYGSVRIVVRLHTMTVGVVDAPLDEDGLSPDGVARAVWSALGDQIDAHLRADDLPAAGALTAAGLPAQEAPACGRAREDLLRAAPSATVLIATRNRADLLARTLESLGRLEYPDVEILVLDGSPGSETAETVRRFPAVRYRNVAPHRKTYALNIGLRAARGELVAFTDDDVVVDRHWLAQLATGFSDPRIACVTGAAFPLELRAQAQAWFEESGGFTDGFLPRTVGLDLPAAKGSLLPYATGKIGAGVNMAWRRSALLGIGGFDVALDALTPLWPPRAGPGTSGEDLSAFFDALVTGHRLAFDPNAIVYHEHRRTYEELERQIYWHGLGISGHLFRCLLRRPGRIPGFLWKVPRGVAYGFTGSSVRNDKKSTTFPPSLARAEWRGVIEGPFAFLRGLGEARRLRRDLATASDTLAD